MTYGLWLSAAGLQTSQYRQNVMANNIANTETVGFKRDLAVIRERERERDVAPMGMRYGHRTLDMQTGGLFVRPTILTFDQGAVQQTNNALDVALIGDGFLTVNDGDATRYTRDGRMTTNAAGEIVLSSNGGRFRVLDEGGRPLQIDRESGRPIAISENGTVYQGDIPLGRLGLTSFEDTTQLTKVGGNLYQNHDSDTNVSTAIVKAGHVEQSTASPMKGLAQMVEVSRAYELNARMISLQDSTIGQAISRVGRVG